ncbi:MAG: chromate transporter [Cytophagaceae bacterium]|jgi:chromate transporter|nr:chromate transporter [Cytophagaceae bacterium]
MATSHAAFPTYSLKELVLYFLKLGTIGFGGPVALVGYMHRDLVDEKKWISESEYKEGLALSQLAPGPLAAQLAIYLGYVHYGIWGSTLTGLAFVLPSFFMVLGIGFLYVSYGGLPWMQAIFYGVGAAVIGIIAVGSYKLSKKSLSNDYVLWGIFALLAITTFWAKEEILWLIILSGGIYWWVRNSPAISRRLYTALPIPLFVLLQAPVLLSEKRLQLTWFFIKAGAFVFGSGLAIVPFLYGGMVNEYQWLSEKEFLDAVAVAMITPGPIVITVGFIGYLIDGIPGACLAALATFLPCYVFTILPAPYFKKFGKHPGIKAFIDGVTAAAVGAIVGAVGVLAQRQLLDVTSVFIALGSAGVLLYFKKIQEPYLILLAALLGVLLYSV